MNRLSDKVILITGSSGIAAATARMAAREGASLFVASLASEECEVLAAELGGGWYAGDLSEEGNAVEAVLSCLDRFGRIDGLFNVAGISGRRFGDGPLHECSAEGWDTVMKMNLRSLFLMSREVLRAMVAAARPGSIVNMSSVLASSPEPHHFATHAYAAAKAAVMGVTTSAAAFYAPQKIRINAVAPGLVATSMSRRAQESEEIQRLMRRKQPLPEGFLSPDDVASAAVFLLSDESRHITGEVLTVDGGWRFGS